MIGLTPEQYRHLPVQPKEGDLVLSCAHAMTADRCHFLKGFDDGQPAPCVAPDGTTSFPDWLVICDACYRLHAEDIRKVTFTDLWDWVGDEPILKSGGDA